MRIEDYGLIGNGETAALVGRDASIDWLCWPRFDSEACFAALLGNPGNGCWSIVPDAPVTLRSRRYRGDTPILETTLETASGAIRIIDFMPVNQEMPALVRIVEGIRGTVPVGMNLCLRFGYGARAPWLRKEASGDMKAISGPHAAVLRSTVDFAIDDHSAIGRFSVCEGQRLDFVLAYGPSFEPPRDLPDAASAMQATERFWDEWCKCCAYQGAWGEPVRRSLITIKALIYGRTGGIIAAPTTSLPEQAGGSRNWDYRYCWLRDATFVLLMMMSAGYRQEAEAWTDWLLRAVAGSSHQVQPVYGVAGENWLGEREADHLAGFNGARPVRIGNDAFRQRQIDVFGEVMDVMHHARRSNFTLREADWTLQTSLVSYLEEIWNQPDEGIWEVRGGPRHFVHSKVMAWVAFDRAVKAIEGFGLEGPVGQWSRIRDEIRAQVCERGFDAQRGAFVQSYGSKELDSSTLLIPLVGFLPADDPRVAGTVRAIEKELAVDGLVLRYRTEHTDDGLPPGEGVFLACSFWMADNYILQGRYGDAKRLFEHLLSLRNDLGLLAEEYDPRTKTQLGNFPQALSHLTLAGTALNLDHAASPTRERSREGS